MDTDQPSQPPELSDSPRNLSFKNVTACSQEEEINEPDAENDDPVTEFPVYCMSDASGCLNFNLSEYPDAALNPLEQKNLGRQLLKCIKDHLSKYRNCHPDQNEEYFQEESERFSSLSQNLYDDFITSQPGFRLSHQTYANTYNFVTSLKDRNKPFSAASFPETKNNSPNPLHPPLDVSTKMSSLSHDNTGAFNPPIVPSLTKNSDGGKVHETGMESLCEKETIFFNRLDIHRKNDCNIPKIKSSKDRHLSDALGSSARRKKKARQNIFPLPLPPRCSCSMKNCLSVFVEKERQQLCKTFWSGKNVKGNLQWVGASIQGYSPNSFNSLSKLKNTRTHFLFGKYFLHKPGIGKQNVCRNFFLTTLGLHYLFPLYDNFKQKREANKCLKSNGPLSSRSTKGRKRLKKKKTILKHNMKRHIHRYFKKQDVFLKMPISDVEYHANKYFKHFSVQFPHLIERKSFGKYLTIVCKFLKRRKVDGSSSSSGKPLSEGRSESDQTTFSVNSSTEIIMKIKPEDFDEVLADDIEEKFKVGSEDTCVEPFPYFSTKRQSIHPSERESEAPALEEDSSPQHQLSNNTNNLSLLLKSQIYPDNFADKKCKRKPYTKVKKVTNKRKKSYESKKTLKQGKAGLDLNPKKSYKIAVNEIEDDQAKHPMLPPCNCSKNNCLSKIPEEKRQEIHDEFWNFDNISRRAWMVKHVHILKPKSRSNLATARLHQMHRKFFLPNLSRELQDVCKKFFLSTLGFKGVGVLRPQQVPGVKNSLPEKETRKRVLSYQVCQQDVISVIQYCTSFSKEKDVSFCGDERFTRTSNSEVSSSGDLHQKITVPYGFTWKELFRDYCTKHSNVEFGYQTFRSILSFVEHNNFSEDLLQKFHSLEGSDSQKNLSKETQENDLEASSFQDQYNLLQSFPKGPKSPKKLTESPKIKKLTVEKKSVSSRTVRKIKEDRADKRVTKPYRKLKLSKSFLNRDLHEEPVKTYTPRITQNSRYNFRAGVPQVSYSFDSEAVAQGDDFFDREWEDDYDGIKKEALSDQEKSKAIDEQFENKPLKKKRGRPPGKKKASNTTISSADKDSETIVDSINKGKSLKKRVLFKVKKSGGGVRGRKKKSWKLKVDLKQQESTARLKNRHPILPPCKCNYRKCHEKIPQAQREVVHDIYWSITSKQDRCKWVLDHIQRCSPKTRSNTGLPSRKRETRRYFFPNDQNDIIEVCRVFFLRTLGYQWDSVVDTVSRSLPRPGGLLAKSLGFSEQQLPYEVITKIKTLLKRKKIKKSSTTAASFADNSQDGENESESKKDEDIILEGHSLKDLFSEFSESNSDHKIDFQGFKQIVHFILVPDSEAQSEWEIKQEQLQNAYSDWVRSGPSNQQGEGEQDLLPAGDGGSRESTVYFTPEFEKVDIEKALTRKARRRRPVSERNLKEQHPMREPCSCVRKCREKIDERKREEIHQEYWDLITYNQRKQWILEHIRREVPKRRTNLKGPIKKMETRKFVFDDWSGNRVEICKGFFLATLGFKWDKMVDTICKTTPRDGQYVRPDQRGKKPPSHKLSDTLISSVTSYVESILETASCVYPKTPNKPGGGKQKKAPDRMPYGLTMKNLFEDYKIKHPNHKVGYESFRKIYRSVIQSDKFKPAATSPMADEEDDEPEMDHLSHPSQEITNASSMLAANVNSASAAERSSEQGVPSFEAAHPSCMYRSQTGMRLHNQDASHLASYQRQCEASAIKPFPEGINSFPKGHDIPFYSPTVEQNEEMSMQMYKSICLPTSNPNQPYSFYPNSLPLDSFPMGSTPQGLHGGLPYAETLRHSELMHHHPYQPTHHPHHPHHHHPHFGQSRFHGFVLPTSSAKEQDPTHHQLPEMNMSHNFRNDFDCNPYTGKSQLIYPPAYHSTDNMPSSNNQRHSFGGLPMQTHAVAAHEIRARDTTTTAGTASAIPLVTNSTTSSSSSSTNNGHVPTSIPSDPVHPPSGSQWAPHLTAPLNLNKASHPEGSPDKKTAKRPTKSRPSKRQPKEKVPKVKKEKKVRPKSNRNSKEYNPMLPPCGCTAKKCLEKIPEPRREVIYTAFWDLGCYNKRKQWIAGHIVREDPKRRTSLDNPLRRMETRRFFLPNEEDEKMEVCKGFFLRTLGFKWDKMVDTICKTTEKGQTEVKPDMRGRKGPSHKLNEEVTSSVENYVRSIVQAAKPAYDATAGQTDDQQPRKGSDKDIFVPYGLTMKNFHDDYKGKHAHHKVGYESFRKIFRRVSQEVLGSVSVDEEDDKSEAMPPALSGEGSDVINPETGLPQST